MQRVTWNSDKNDWLKRTRGISFEDILQASVIDTVTHPKYTHQRILLVEHQNYVWAVPFVKNEKEIFLKTIYKSRQFTKIYRKGRWTL